MAPYFDRNLTPLDLKRLLIIMRRSYIRISILTMIVAGITALYLSTQPPIYKATAILQIPDIHLETQVEILRSDRITENVITALELSSTPDDPAEETAVRHQNFITEFKRQLSISPVKNTRLINISYAHQQPQMAAAIANAYASEYIKLNREFQLQQQINSSSQSSGPGWLDEGALRLKNKVSRAEQEISDFLQQDHPGEDSAISSNKLQRLTSELQTSTELYELVMQQQEETEQNNYAPLAAILTEQAKTPLTADDHNRLDILMITVLITIILLLLQAFLRSLTLVDQDTITQIHAPLLGTLPDIRSAEKNFNRLSPQEIYFSNRIINDAAQSLGIALQLKESTPNKQVIVTTSASAGEGKSTSAIYLAMSLARSKKVILIEADMRKPSIGRKLGIPQSHNGLAGLLLSGGRLADCIWRDKQTGLDIMPASDIPQSPLNLLTSERFKSCLTILKSHYDHIIIDSPPSQPVSDTLIIGQLSDFNILVTRSNYSKKNELTETIAMLSKHNINVDGIILNRIALQDDKYYQYKKKAS